MPVRSDNKPVTMTSQTQIVMPPHVSGAGRLLDEQLMAWVDMAASAEARRHARRYQVINAVVDNMGFLGPAFLDETVRIDARIIWTGRTSLEVRVDSFAESSAKAERLINQSYLLFIVLDTEGKPTPVSPFVPSSEEEKQEWTRAEKRQAERHKAE